MRLRCCLAILCAYAAASVAADSTTCQLLTRDNTSLQSTLGIVCNISNVTDENSCQCSWSLWDSAGWVPLGWVNRTWNGTAPAPPGMWYVRDPTGECVATVSKTVLLPEAQPCPPGFYCAGGLAPPRSCGSGDYCPGRTQEAGRRCPPGFFCPVPGAPPRTCMEGGFCPEGSHYPQACESGFFCQQGREEICPEGHYCPYASVHPRRCSIGAICPPGSRTENVVGIAGGFLLVCTAGALAGARYYDRIVERGTYVCLVCLGLAGVMWLVDKVIAGFLTLAFVMVASNWVLLHVGTCPGYVSRVLLLATLLVALWALWLASPPWSVLAGGLVAVSLLVWLMSSRTFPLVVCGRALLVLTFAALLGAYFVADRHFSVLVCCFLLADLLALVVSSTWRRYWHSEKALPFATRWRTARAARASSGHADSGPAVSAARSEAEVEAGGDAGGPPSWEAFTHMIARGSSSCSSSSSRDIAAWAGGPSVDARSLPSAGLMQCGAGGGAGADESATFYLEGVDFSLPGGQKLLKNVNLRVGPRRRVAVMGASGSGKSTLLAVLSGRASYGRLDGRFLVAGQASQDLRFLQRMTGFVPQDDVLHGELSVRGNIYFQAALRLPPETTAAEVETRVMDAVESVGLTAIADARVGTPELRGVSGGQRKRVSIAMEVVAEPLLLFADEPTSGLDSTTSYGVVRSLTLAAGGLGATVIAVIHQPRYDTLCLFDDLVLLGAGHLIYAGPTQNAMEHFRQKLGTVFVENANPADVMLDRIQESGTTPELFADIWSTCVQAPVDGENPLLDPKRTRREQLPFFRAMMIFVNRSMLQTFRACGALLVNQALLIFTVAVLCNILQYDHFDQFLMQGVFSSLFLMLLQSVAGQRVFGADLLVTWREASGGMSMVAYFVAKDLAALFEVTLSSAVFTAMYGWLSGTQMDILNLFAGAWAFVFAVYGMAYIFSITLSPTAAQMSAVVSTFLSFCVSGAYQPQLPELAAQMGGRGWMVPAMSPVRWLWGYLITQESRYLSPISRDAAYGKLLGKGYDLAYLEECTSSLLGITDPSVLTLRQAWLENRGWVCSTAPLLLLGLIFRFLACMCLLICVHAHTSGWALFFAHADVGAWRLVGHFFKVFVATFIALFFLAEVWIFGILNLSGWIAATFYPVV